MRGQGNFFIGLIMLLLVVGMLAGLVPFLTDFISGMLDLGIADGPTTAALQFFPWLMAFVFIGAAIAFMFSGGGGGT